ncbi:alpha/beta fold hydrolase [Sporosarcina limicola]|uniref:Pimeloyl-ACP methyl ester carboxylesterase n=1 Tax=Sporosarcina limicola TaxID=34101 RepID=A0A927MK82_9BACL|nr:alpha/beta hydrolase [Sporosarcina limicola]MBE1556264.1 pimeloyl-ACP methyl ester carboxylesterase [Sporosarcina limicola]
MEPDFPTKNNKELFTPIGRLVDIGDIKLHIYVEGVGSPTVIFDTGHGTCSAVTEWSLVQPEVAKITRTIVYDRAGMGWSEESKNSRNSEQIVEELHSLLVNSDEKPPYILVGHSFGALNMILFANKYPDKVAGLVLVDGGSVDFYRNYFKAPKLLMYTLNIFNKMGIFRVFGKLGLIPHIRDRRKRLTEKMVHWMRRSFINIT